MTEAAAPLTLAELADDVAEQFADMRAELARLRQENARLRGHEPEHLKTVDPHASQERTSRRQMLGTGLKLAAGALGAGVMLAQQSEPASADADHTSTHFIESNGIWAIAAEGTSADANGVYATSESENQAAVQGANSAHGPGIDGQSFGNGVQGRSFNPNASGVYGLNQNAGFGVAGDATSAATADDLLARAGVFGRNNGTGAGVLGLSLNANGDGVLGSGKIGIHGKSANGNGVMGEGGNGYGGQFKGNRAQLRLAPTTRIGKPTTGSHQIGELYLDKVGALFLCTIAGTPGTWRKVSTTAT